MRGGSSLHDTTLFTFGFGSSKKFWVLSDSDTDLDPQHESSQKKFVILLDLDKDSDPQH
jgi:hypothetical protein